LAPAAGREAFEEQRAPIKIIADHARYESEAAFSRAFKRRFGVPPGGWRRRQAQGLG